MPKWGPEFFVSLDVFSTPSNHLERNTAVLFNSLPADMIRIKIPGVTEFQEFEQGKIATNSWYKVEIEQKRNHKGEVKNNISLLCVSWV